MVDAKEALKRSTQNHASKVIAESGPIIEKIESLITQAIVDGKCSILFDNKTPENQFQGVAEYFKRLGYNVLNKGMVQGVIDEWSGKVEVWSVGISIDWVEPR